VLRAFPAPTVTFRPRQGAFVDGGLRKSSGLPNSSGGAILKCLRHRSVGRATPDQFRDLVSAAPVFSAEVELLTPRPRLTRIPDDK